MLINDKNATWYRLIYAKFAADVTPVYQISREEAAENKASNQSQAASR